MSYIVKKKKIDKTEETQILTKKIFIGSYTNNNIKKKKLKINNKEHIISMVFGMPN